jgi:hypothetical protein
LTDVELPPVRKAQRMSETTTSQRPVSFTMLKYWLPVGLLCLIFLVSAALTIFDPEGTKVASVKLGFPTFLAVYPLAAA